MIQFFRLIKQNIPYLWYLIEYVNGIIINIRYGKNISKATQEFGYYKSSKHYIYRPLTKTDLSSLANLLASQPTDFDHYFKPHGFDLKSLSRQIRNKSFLMLGVFKDEQIIGYFFIRFFINKKAFRGKMVDSTHQGQGIAKRMGIIMTNIAFNAGFRLFATISKANLSSIASSKAVNSIQIIEELPGDYIYVEYTRLKH